jgi:hypothetical protein
MYELNAESNFEIKDVEDYILMFLAKNKREWKCLNQFKKQN